MAGGLFSLAEGALMALTGKRLRGLLKNETENGHLHSLLYHKREIAFSVRLIALGGLICWMILYPLGTLLNESDHSPFTIAELIGTALVLGAVMRLIAIRIGIRISTRSPIIVRKWLHVIGIPLRPLTLMVRGGTGLADRIFGMSNLVSEEERITEDVMSAVDEGERRDVIEEEQKEMIRSILDMEDCDVAEIMTPRVKMVSIAADTPFDEAVKFSAEHSYSRIPAYLENRDNIVGTLYVKDLLEFVHSPAKPDTIRRILRDPLLVPESKMIAELLREFQAKKVHLAIVLDEYGGTAGIVTLEDVLEEIVGEIRDEFDSHEVPPVKNISENIIEAEATAHIDEINEALGTSLPESAEYETVGGLVFDLIGRVPTQNEKITCDGAVITILRSDKRRIYRVRVARIVPEN